MEHLQTYYFRQSVQHPFIGNAPAKGLKGIVCIPVYNEPDVLQTLESLLNCQPPAQQVEVLLLINDHEKSDPEIKKQNQATLIQITDWIKNHPKDWIHFYVFYLELLPLKHAGVGFARKLLMDEAIRRFILAGESEGFIFSLDADSLVAPEYFTVFEEHLHRFPNTNAVTFQFEHPLDTKLNDSQIHAIILYETHVRYFKQALQATGFPYPFYTIGSCFSVRANAYAKQGGMNRRQAGEDFYFLHKIFPLGNCYEIPRVTVYPSPRISDRVPFGTGPAIAKILNEGNFYTYRLESFGYLKQFFNLIPQFYSTEGNNWLSLLTKIPEPILNFVGNETMEQKLVSIKQNTASEKSFAHRFFSWFDAFQVIKFLNQYHLRHPKIPVSEASKKLLTEILPGEISFNEPLKILSTFRLLDQSSE